MIHLPASVHWQQDLKERRSRHFTASAAKTRPYPPEIKFPVSFPNLYTFKNRFFSPVLGGCRNLELSVQKTPVHLNYSSLSLLSLSHSDICKRQLKMFGCLKSQKLFFLKVEIKEKKFEETLIPLRLVKKR